MAFAINSSDQDMFHVTCDDLAYTMLLNLTEKMYMTNSNQCQGCQAGWPTEEHRPWPPSWQVDKTKTITFHVVVGGYEGEKCVCTKSKYEE